MPMTCVVYGCKNHFVKGCGKQFFRFPMKDPDRLSKWVLAIRRKVWNLCASSRICSDHFTENDYMIRPGAIVPRLRLDAVPSVFDGFPNHLKEPLKRKKPMKKADEQITVIGNRHGSQDTDQSEVDKVQTCAVHGCNNMHHEGCQQVFFRFPANDPKLLSKWLVAIHRQNCASLTSRSVCSDHFTEKDYIHPGVSIPQLGPDAVPSLLIALPREIPAAVPSQDAQQVDPPGDNHSKDQITVRSEIIKPSLHEISNEESSSVKKQQVKHGSLERSCAVTCAVHGCNSVFVKGCGKRFLRFPLKRPEHLSKWVKALKCCDWKPSASSRICSDHFKDEDYIVLPGVMAPRLRLSAVPSVNPRKCRRKPVTATPQHFRDCRSTKVIDGFQEPEIQGACDHTYSAFHIEESLPRFTPDTMKLKKKVRTLQRQIQRQRHTIKKLSERIEQLKGNSAGIHQN